jgi:hypothetical protein
MNRLEVKMDKYQYRTGLLDLTVSEGGTVYMESDILETSIIISPVQIPTIMLALSQALINRKEQQLLEEQLLEDREALLQSLSTG